MGELSNMIRKVSSLDGAIEDALRHEVSDVIRQFIVDAAYENVYEAYEPEFYNRRNGNGGILDKDSITVEVIGNELIAMDTKAGTAGYRGWQQLWGGDIPEGRLAEAIATGDERYNMEEAGPRPFHEKAKQMALESGQVEEALRRGLLRQGIDSSGMTFRFI